MQGASSRDKDAGVERPETAIEDTFNGSNESGNAIFTKQSPTAAGGMNFIPAVSFEESADNSGPSPAALALLNQKSEQKRIDQMQKLESEVGKMKDILARLLDDITISLPLHLRSEMQTCIEVADAPSPPHNFDMPGQRAELKGSNSCDSSEVSYSEEAKSPVNYGDYTHGADGACSGSGISEDSDFLSRLSSSNWSARISTKLNFERCHDKIKGRIPMLDLDNLPDESSAEDDYGEDQMVMEVGQDDDMFVEQELG